MPFDQQNFETMPADEVLAVLIKARELIAPSHCWLQWQPWERNERGEIVAACALGALNWVIEKKVAAPTQYDAACATLYSVLPGGWANGTTTYDIAWFNNKNSHADVLALFDRAIAARRDALSHASGPVASREAVSA